MALAEQNFQMELALTASKGRIEAIGVLGKARVEVLQGTVTDLEENQSSLVIYRAKEEETAAKDLEAILASQKMAVESLKITYAAKVKATEDALWTQYRIGLPLRIQKAKDVAKSETEEACRKKSDVIEKALILKQNKQIRRLIDATRDRLDFAYRRMNNTVIPELTQQREYYLKTAPKSPAYTVADGALRHAGFPLSHLFPEYFIVVGFDMRITK